jgi:peptide/nickel transport system substrate-binding protein
MKKGFAAATVVLSMAFLLSPFTHAASPAPSTAQKASATVKPQTGGIWKISLKTQGTRFGYPPGIVGAERDFAPPFFNRLLAIGDDGKYQPELALSWDASKDGKTIIFKLRKGVTFHDGTAFNAQAVKSNLDKLIPPNPVVLDGITSVDVVDDDTVKINLNNYNNLILYQLASNYSCYMYSPTALQKNGADWAATHPVGTGPFMLKDFERNNRVTLVKNPHYWEKGLPYLDGIEMRMVIDPMSQVVAFKAGETQAIYDVLVTTAAQLRDNGYPLKVAPGNLQALSFDSKNSPYFSNPLVRQAMECAIDKEAICEGPGEGLYTPAYQMVPSTSPDYNKAVALRKYDPVKAKKLLAQAGYPHGFGFKAFVPSMIWRDGIVAAQSYLAEVGIKMEIEYLNTSAFMPIRASGKIERGAAAYTAIQSVSNNLYMMDYYFRSDSSIYQYMVRPAGIDKLIDEAKRSRSPAVITKINQQINKLLYDDATLLTLYNGPRIAVTDKSVQDSGWFIAGDSNNSQFGTRTWLKK